MVAKPKQKTRVGVRIKETVGKKSLNRSSDLDQLTQRFNALQEKQKNLILALKTQHASICQMATSRLMVADNLAAITKDSELYGCAGQMPTETLAKHEVCSYASIHHELASRTKMYADKYGQFVINYAIEWDKVVTQRVMTGLKETDKLRRDLDHYQKKTESLRTGVNQTMAKGKQVDKKTEERLGRNEEKLKTAREQYNKVATSMCVLIEEVTERAWKDIHPMLLKIAQFDYTLSSDETKALEELNTVQQKLRKLADEHQLKPESRLKDIQTLQASLLSTKKEQGGLSLEADPNASGAFGGMDSMGGMAMPPGTVSPQGMGGFPVPIPAAYSGISRASSVTSMSSGYGSSTMNTSEMLAIAAAAAPPPTMDEVNNATNALTISTAPNTGYSSYSSPSNGAYQRSGSLPPDFGQSNVSYGRSSSMASYGDADSSIASYTSAPAPAPAAPPPPPPSSYGGYPPAPAPAPMTMYGGAPAPVSAPLPPSYGGMQQQPPAPWTASGGQPPQSPSNQYGQQQPPNQYGMPPQSPSNQFGQQQPPNQYGMPPQSPSNQFGQQQPPNQFGAPSPLNNNGYGNYGNYGNQ